MRIGFDAKRAVSNMTGLGNYSRLVIEALAKLDNGENELILYAPEMRPNPRLGGIKRMNNVEFRFPGPVGFRGGAWRTFGITNHLLADGIDVYHGLSNELPLNIRKGGVASVVTLHDAIYRRLPHCYNSFDRRMYDFKYGRSCRAADKVVAVSECTKRDCMELYGVPEDRIEVIYQGCDDQFRRTVTLEDMAALKRRLGLPERYVVQVGTVEWRKNLALSAMAMAAVPEDVKLVAVGRDRKGYRRQVIDAARRAGVDDSRIIWVEGLPFSDLPALYHGAEAALLPSRYEGFGIPVIEAIECGTPFIGATGSCLEEAGGPDSYYVSPDDSDELAARICDVLEGGEEVERRCASSKRYVERFSTEEMARKLMSLYESLR